MNRLKKSQADRADRIAVIRHQPKEPAAVRRQMGKHPGKHSSEKECVSINTEVRRSRAASIAIDVTPVHPGGANGGVKQLVLELLKGFGERRDSNKYILLTSYINDEIFKEFDKYGMKRICVLKEPAEGKKSILRVGRALLAKIADSYKRHGILKRNGVSVLFCPFTAPTYVERGIPTVSIICDLQHMYYPSFFGRAEYEQRQHYYLQLKRKVDYFICISEYTRQTAIDKLALPVSRTFTIPICVQSRIVIPSPDFVAVVLRKYNLEGKLYAFYPANLWPHKNHRMLFVAFRMFLSRHPEIDLHLVLTGARIEGNLGELPSKMGMGDRVHFLDYLDELELSVVWSGAHFLLFPSLFEGFGIPLVEAMMYGKPILASNVTSIPEVAGDAALYFDPRRPDTIVGAMFKVMSDNEVYNDLIVKGGKRLRQFNFSAMVDRYLDVLHLADSKGGVINYTDIVGIYEDSWAAERIAVTHERSSHDKKFILRGIVPAWHPRSRMRIRTFKDGVKRDAFVVQRRESFVVEETLPARGGIFDIVVADCFIPDNGDSRKLTFNVESASIVEGQTGRQLYRFGDAV